MDGAVKPPATSVDVARLAGVSQSAVSRAFTPGASVSPRMRKRVEDAATRLGYQPNAHARSLTTGRSRIIGLVLSSLDNLLYPAVTEKLALRLQQDGYHLLMFVSDQRDSDDLVREILQYRVDGIVLGATTLSSGLARRCAQARIPVVLFNRVMAASGVVSSVRSDNVGGAAEIARFLVAGGHRRIAYVAGREDSSTNLERERGFTEGLAALGHAVCARSVGDYAVEGARRATLALFGGDAGVRPDAVFVAGDLMALSVMDTLRHELGLRVPQAAWPSYRLTTFEQPVGDMVEAAVDLLHRSLVDGHGDGGDAGPSAATQARDVIVPGRLVVRASARVPTDAQETP
jgi:DNA-binding LacI/PurR family transcriptional regulator